MMKVRALLSLLILVLGLTVGSTQRYLFAADNEKESADLVYRNLYQVGDLGVFTSDRKFDPSVLMRLIQASTPASDWEASGGVSTMYPYAQNVSLVISTNRKNHDKIVDLLESMRAKK